MQGERERMRGAKSEGNKEGREKQVGRDAEDGKERQGQSSENNGMEGSEKGRGEG